jgi:hypothetical protein
MHRDRGFLLRSYRNPKYSPNYLRRVRLLQHQRELPVTPPIERDAGDAEALAQGVDYYHATLLGSPEALAYLRSRRVEGPEAVVFTIARGPLPVARGHRPTVGYRPSLCPRLRRSSPR